MYNIHIASYSVYNLLTVIHLQKCMLLEPTADMVAMSIVNKRLHAYSYDYRWN